MRSLAVQAALVIHLHFFPTNVRITVDDIQLTLVLDLDCGKLPNEHSTNEPDPAPQLQSATRPIITIAQIDFHLCRDQDEVKFFL